MRLIVSVFLVLVVLCALPGCRSSGASADASSSSPDPEEAKAVAAALARCEIAGDSACVARRLNLDAKAAVLFGDLWTAASAEPRAATRAMLLGHFMAAAKKLRTRHFDGKIGEFTATVDEPDLVVVTEEGEGLRLEYRVIRQDGVWRVADRIRISGKHRADPGVLVKKFLKDFEANEGRVATLDDVNQGLPEFLGTHRARTIRIPKGRRGRP